jgi:hypothetical protein
MPNRRAPALEERRRLRIWIHPTSHRFEGGCSGDFLERVRLTIANVGLHLRPPDGIPPLDCLMNSCASENRCTIRRSPASIVNSLAVSWEHGVVNRWSFRIAEV